MVKSTLILLLTAIIYTILFLVASALLPYSQRFRELNSSEHPMALLFMFVSGAWICFTVYFIVKHANCSGKKLFINVVCIIFFINSFMTQIETWFFGHAFSLTQPDIILIMLSGLFPLAGTAALLVKFFQNEKTVCEKPKMIMKDLFIRLGIVGMIYLCVYMLFGYFVAWQFEDLRLFYSGSTEKLSFWSQMANNIRTTPIIIPFQIIRGILFAIFILPLRDMMNTKKTFIVSVCLVYLCTAIQLVIPNVLFPDMVRIAHLFEMTSSMLLFGIITGNIMWKNSNDNLH
jgi:hypothetical protein